MGCGHHSWPVHLKDQQVFQGPWPQEPTGLWLKVWGSWRFTEVLPCPDRTPQSYVPQTNLYKI